MLDFETPRDLLYLLSLVEERADQAENDTSEAAAPKEVNGVPVEVSIQASIGPRRLARRSGSSEYQTHLTHRVRFQNVRLGIIRSRILSISEGLDGTGRSLKPCDSARIRRHRTLLDGVEQSSQPSRKL